MLRQSLMGVGHLTAMMDCVSDVCWDNTIYLLYIFILHHSFVLDLVTKVWNDNGDLMTTESDLNISVGSDQYTFHLERLETSPLAGDDTCNSMSTDELWNTIQISRFLPTSPFVHVHPKHNGASLPKLLCNDKGDSAKTVLKYTNLHAKMPSLYPLTASLPLKKAAMSLRLQISMVLLQDHVRIGIELTIVLVLQYVNETTRYLVDAFMFIHIRLLTEFLGLMNRIQLCLILHHIYYPITNRLLCRTISTIDHW